MRYQHLGIAAAVIVGLASSGALAAQLRVQKPTGVVINPNLLNLSLYHLGCPVWGTPVDFPNDVELTNTGGATIPSGYKIHWDVPAPHHEGTYTFTAPLPAGQHVFIGNAVPGGAGRGEQCTTTAVK